jgi:ubiquinone/menaquinone biosynthesis C-methylase UbiE
MAGRIIYPTRPPKGSLKRRTRLGRVLSNWGSRGRTAKELRENRKKDREAFAGKRKDYPVFSGLETYSRMFQKELDGVVQERLKTEPKADVLEISAGAGNFLKELKQRFGKRIRTVSTGLTRPQDTTGIDSPRVYRFMQSNPKPLQEGQFDIIVCVSGETQTMKPAEIRERVLRLLKVGGTAFIDFGANIPHHGGKLQEFVWGVEDSMKRSGEFKVIKTLHPTPREIIMEEVTLMEIKRVR